MKNTLHLAMICATAIVCSVFFYFSVGSLNRTILEAANVAGDKMSPALQPTKHTVTVDGGMVVGNRKGGSFTVGMTMGKER